MAEKRRYRKLGQLGRVVAISDFGPTGGPEPGVLSNRSSLVAQRLRMFTLWTDGVLDWRSK
jgi:hypothetical protein